MGKKTKSEHIFIFPFSWKYRYKNNQTLFMQHQQLQENMFNHLKRWEVVTLELEEDAVYNELVYFYQSIRPALYTFSRLPFIVKNYKRKAVNRNSLFQIVVKGRVYTLRLKEISLKLYKTGIGLLSFQLLNESYEAIEDLQAINSFGECIYPPSLPVEKVMESGSFPEKVRIFLDEGEQIEEDFSKAYDKEGLKMSSFILKILGDSFSGTKKYCAFRRILIEPLLGHHMYLLCLYENKLMTQKLLAGKMSYVGISGLIKNQRKEPFFEKDEMAYLKSSESIYGISSKMLLCLTQELTEARRYNQLVSLVLMQRATLLNLSTELARVSTLPKGDLAPAISSIYEIYVQFINQLYFKEVTEDTEGTRLYDQLSKYLRIEEEMSELNFEMNEINEYATLVEQSNSHFKVQILTFIGAALVVPSFVTGFFGMNIFKEEIFRWWRQPRVILWLNTYVIFPIVVVMACCMLSKRRTKKQFFLKVFCILLVLLSVSITFRWGCGL